MQLDTVLMTPGPVQMSSDVLLAGAQPLKHHRTADFGPIYAETVKLCKKFFGTNQELFLTTSSGTGAMETAIANFFNPGDKILTVQTGVFGERFTKIAQAYRLEPVVIACEDGKRVQLEQIKQAISENPDIKGITVTFNETSTGIRNHIQEIGEFLKDKDVLFITDGVSGIGALPFKMDEWHVDVAVSASQKGFLAPPGIGMIGVSQKAWKKAEQVECHSHYFDLKLYKQNFEKNVPANPWTPAITVLYSLLHALQKIDEMGIDNLHKHFNRLACGLREALKALGIKIFTEPDATSDVLTVFHCPEGIKPSELVALLRNDYGILIAAGQGKYADSLLRITTIGSIGERDLVATIGLMEMILAKKGIVKDIGTGITALLKYFMNN